MGNRGRVIAATLVAMGLLQAPWSAGGTLLQCLQSCNNIADCDPAGGAANCSSARSLCESSCQAGGDGGGASRAPLPRLEYGAIVYDTATGMWGNSWRWGNGQAAFKAAQQACYKSGGRQCEVHIPIQNGCAVVAAGEGRQGLTGYQKSGGPEALAYAQSHALASCASLGGRSCKEVAHTCSWGN